MLCAHALMVSAMRSLALSGQPVHRQAGKALLLTVREAFCLVLLVCHAPSCRLVKSHCRSVMNSQPDGILSLDG